MDTKEQDVKTFLTQFKQKMSSNIGGDLPLVLHRKRAKNLQTLLELELNSNRSVIEILNNLTARNFYKGPSKDSGDGPDLWEFGMVVKNREVYIKITKGELNKPVQCISFHSPERKISYPFK